MDPAEQVQANMARMKAAAQRKNRPGAGMVMATTEEGKRPTSSTSTTSTRTFPPKSTFNSSLQSTSSVLTPTSAPSLNSQEENETIGQERIRRRLEQVGVSPAVDAANETPKLDGKVEVMHLDISDTRSFLGQPPPKVGMIQCYIQREKHPLYGCKYNLILEDNDLFLLSSVKRKHNKTSNYLISLDRDDLNRDSGHFYGKLRSNFVGTEFTVFDKGEKPNKDGDVQGLAPRQEIAAVIYERNILGTKGPRKMCVLIPHVDENGRRTIWKPEKEEDGLVGRFKKGSTQGMIIMKNKEPSWNDQLRAYVLNFGGRVTMASVKNFQLVDQDHPNKVLMQFGKVDADKFTLDFQYPVSGLQAFGIALSAFDGKLACE
eukprot:GGOE01007880.1.p1 GENE.GGOE01007880.1~~GGOE01007880.1.p1  ORF type:complete len:385 (-),score=83.20 GGOE01007880.1:545-1666(-)